MSASAPTPNGSLRDDSAIDKSWDRVVGDYKAFHDVWAQGGTVSDLPMIPSTQNEPETTTQTRRDAKAETNGAVEETVPDGAAADGVITSDIGGDVDDGPVASGSQDGSTSNEAKPGPTSVTATHASLSGTDSQAPGPSDTNMPPVPSLPQAVLGGADDSMKKLLMSWYYAGYYTGLYEGEQKALQKQQQDKQSQGQNGEASSTRDEQS